MRETSATYKSLRAAGAQYETRIVRGNNTYSGDTIRAVSIQQAAFSDSGPSIGGTFSACCSVELFETSANWPRGSVFDVQVRLVSGSQASEWLQMGKFYTDTRTQNKTGTLSITAYDAMLTTEQHWTDKIPDALMPSEWPITAYQAGELLETAIGIQIDPRTELDDNVAFIGLDTTATARDTLADIAAAHGGNWTITPEGKFRLIPFVTGRAGSPAIAGIAIAGIAIVGVTEAPTEGVDETYLGILMEDITVSTALAGVASVTLETESGISTTAGEGSYALYGTCNFVTASGVASLALSRTYGFTYKPFSAVNALLDPAVEVGDLVVADEDRYQIFSIDWNIAPMISANISAPFEEEVDHEYTIESPAAKVMKKTMAAQRESEDRINSYISQTASNIRLGVERDFETKEAADTKYTELASQIEITAEAITSTVSAQYATKDEFMQSVESLQDQIDGAIETYSGSVVPTLNNPPANAWNTVAKRDEHIGDIYTVDADGGDYAGHYYRFTKSGSTYFWEEITDSPTALALAAAQAAQAQADAVADDLNQHYTTTVDMQSAIDQTASSITSTVSAIYTTKADFDALSVGSVNLLKRADFEGRTYFSQNVSGSRSFFGIEIPKHTDSETSGYYTFSTANVWDAKKFKLNEPYTVSFWAKTAKGGTTLGFDIGPDTFTGVFASKSFDVDTTAKQFTVSGNLTNTGSPTTMQFRWWRSHADNNQIIQIYDIKVERGSKATDWSPAPEDVVGTREIISRINQTPEEITIDASRVNLNGYVTVTGLSGSGTTTINGSNITTGTIDASRVSVTNLNASNISTGTLDASRVTVSNLSANSINSGTLDASRVSVTNLSASSITTGTLNGSNITVTNLNAENITAGTLNVARIANGSITGGPEGKIGSGTITTINTNPGINGNLGWAAEFGKAAGSGGSYYTSYFRATYLRAADLNVTGGITAGGAITNGSYYMYIGGHFCSLMSVTIDGSNYHVLGYSG